MKDRFFFCYDWKLNEYLKNQGILFITKALHPQSKKPFTLYQQSEELASALSNYKNTDRYSRS